MPKFATETVQSVHHWDDKLFSFKTSRSPGLRFRNGEFIMIGLMVEGKPLLRAYSIASANHEDHLEFFSIKVQSGALTSKLQHLEPGNDVLIGSKPTGTLVTDDLRAGASNLYLMSTGTGLAPFLSIVQDPAIYENFEKIVLFHGTRYVSELAYHDWLRYGLPEHPLLGEWVREKLIYYPAVTREPYPNQGRLTDLIRSGELGDKIGLPNLNPETDRAMLCGSPSMLSDVSTLLDDLGFVISPRTGGEGDYVVERAFVER